MTLACLPSRRMPDPAPHVLVVRRRYLGDIVLLGPVFRNLRLHWPHARIAALIEQPYAGVLALNPDVDETFVLPQRANEWPRFLARLRRAGFTHVFDFDNTEKTALVTRLTGASCRVALHHGGFSVKMRWCYNQVVHHPTSEHETHPITEYYLQALPAAGVPIATREVRLIPRAEDLAFARDLLEAKRAIQRSLTRGPHSPPAALVHPGSRSPFRLWPAERFATVIDRLRRESGIESCLVAGPGEEPILKAICGHVGWAPLVIDEPLSVGQFAALATQFAVMLCPDSGPMHLAAAVGVPVVALLGSQNPVLFSPAGDGHIVLRPPMPCRTCVAPNVCVPGDSYRNYCIRNIDVETVLAAIRRQLSR